MLRGDFDRACDGEHFPTRHALQLGSGRAPQPQLVSRRSLAPIRTQTKNASLGGGICKSRFGSSERAFKDDSETYRHFLWLLIPAAQSRPRGDQVDASLKQPIALQTGVSGAAVHLCDGRRRSSLEVQL